MNAAEVRQDCPRRSIPLDAFDEIVLASALRARLAHERARMHVLFEQLTHARMLVRDAAAIRAHLRAALAYQTVR
ncbi:hypothetical protein X734_19995 [Mesorhizobium sp. L2C084A000]|nr:hypothetical protein X734_19995 [Mesorhizobium sp. L2C084A000]